MNTQNSTTSYKCPQFERKAVVFTKFCYFLPRSACIIVNTRSEARTNCGGGLRIAGSVAFRISYKVTSNVVVVWCARLLLFGVFLRVENYEQFRNKPGS